ncbi:hypothetical protein BIY24_10120 [Halobacteriovorax marinus]|uniref:hypothetical protein n=1 Tax=Halobacteriovorax marinus TaxID=97084 RepID=UPI000BC33641|nr:hypothetical protein [Halobacteriovorax marinus]ATH08289.1 hypothetical protein BIY24_10120 [Halobacteriovorax marinus]
MVNKNNLTTILFLGTFSLAMSSCSSGYSYKKPESFEEKISRYEARSLNTNLVPEVQVSKSFKHTSRKSRGPASVSTSSSEDKGYNQYNNKRLYFLTLYSQYQQIKPLASNESVAIELNHCPSFHTSFLSYNESSPKSTSARDYKMPFKSMESLRDADYMTRYPEFFLPVSRSSTRPRVIDMAIKDNLSASKTKELVKSAINIHVAKTYSELTELCETGSSSNYYIYENLMTHIKTRDKISADQIGLKTLFKTTLFSNMALTTSIKRNQRQKSRGIASVGSQHGLDQEVIKRLEVPWVESYLQSK